MTQSIEISKIEDVLDRLMENLPCKAEGPYPEAKAERENPRYAKLILDAYADGGKSELTAIGQYMYHHFTIPVKEISNTLLCIALIEMKHLDILADLIKELGGNPKFYKTNKAWWNSSEVSYGDNTCLKLKMDIEGETAAIAGYEILLSEINDKYVREVLNRLLLDEKIHLSILNHLLDKYCTR